MANLKEIRNRITSVGSTMQITSAMKMVSAAKLKRAQDAITQMRPYANKLTELLVNLSSSLDTSEGGEFSSDRPQRKILLVAITSNRGLCGGFNANIIKKINLLIKEDFKESQVSILSIGKKSFVSIAPFPSIGCPKGFTTRPSIGTPTGTSTTLPVRFARSPSFT